MKTGVQKQFGQDYAFVLAGSHFLQQRSFENELTQLLQSFLVLLGLQDELCSLLQACLVLNELSGKLRRK